MKREIEFVRTIYGTVELEFDKMNDDIHSMVAEKISNGDYIETNEDLEINTADIYK